VQLEKINIVHKISIVYYQYFLTKINFSAISLEKELISMAITTKESILKVLSAYNPWWKTGMVSLQMSKTYKRFAFHESMKRLMAKDHL